MRIRRPKASRLIGALALALGILLPGITAASASVAAPGRAAAHLSAAASGELQCDGDGSGNICVTDKNGSQSIGTVISGSARTGHADQLWALVLTGSCGNSKVSGPNECPFTPGSGLNAKFNGKNIITICLVNNPQRCVADAGSTRPTLQVPSATGTVWILDDAALVNRVESNSSRQASYLTTDGAAGDQLETNTFLTPNFSEWGSP